MHGCLLEELQIGTYMGQYSAPTMLLIMLINYMLLMVLMEEAPLTFPLRGLQWGRAWRPAALSGRVPRGTLQGDGRDRRRKNRETIREQQL